MAKSQPFDKYHLEYYDDFVENYCYFECTDCKVGSRNGISSIMHKKGCSTPKNQKKDAQIWEKERKIKKAALSKLTRKEKKVLGLLS